MRRPFIAGNWKMNTRYSDAIVLASGIKDHVAEYPGVEVVIFPPFTWLYPISELFEHSPRNLKLGAQNCYFKEEGAYTGEVSPEMIKGLVKYVILGHSERRNLFYENSELVNEKVHAAFRNNLIPIVCIGEKKGPVANKGGKSEALENLLTELRESVGHLPKDKARQLIVAYEPVWAIGTGKAATGSYAAFIIEEIRRELEAMYGRDIAVDIRILYGGSVAPANAEEFLKQPEIDGLLVGGASLKQKDFLEICKAAA